MKRQRGIFGRIAVALWGERCGSEYCWNRIDPRCVAGLCPYHCTFSWNCNGRCKRVAQTREEIEREILEKMAGL